MRIIYIVRADKTYNYDNNIFISAYKQTIETFYWWIIPYKWIIKNYEWDYKKSCWSEIKSNPKESHWDYFDVYIYKSFDDFKNGYYKFSKILTP